VAEVKVKASDMADGTDEPERPLMLTRLSTNISSPSFPGSSGDGTSHLLVLQQLDVQMASRSWFNASHPVWSSAVHF
jgi:hypothetical protein